MAFLVTLAGFVIRVILGILGILSILGATGILSILSILLLSFCFLLGNQFLSGLLSLLELAYVAQPLFVLFTSFKPNITLPHAEAFPDYLCARGFLESPYLTFAALDIGAIFDKEQFDAHLSRLRVRLEF